MPASPPSSRAAASSRWILVRKLLAFAAVVLVFVLCVMALRRIAADVTWAGLLAVLHATPTSTVLIALALTVISFGALTLYDVGALACIRRWLPLRVVALTSFCSYAISNTAGFGPVTAAAVRYRLYTPYGIHVQDIARMAAYISTAFLFGLTAVASLALVGAPASIPVPGVSAGWLRAIGLVLLGVLFGVWWAAGEGHGLRWRRFTLRLPSRRILSLQYLASAVDVVASGTALWFLLPDGAPPLLGFLALYLVALALAVLSHVPGGLGVLETIIVAALTPTLPVEGVLGALVLYRIIYHVLPLLIALTILATLEAYRLRHGPPPIQPPRRHPPGADPQSRK